MKKLTVTFLVPDFYKVDDLKSCIECGLDETLAIVESNPTRTVMTNMKIESVDEENMIIKLVEDHERNLKENNRKKFFSPFNT